MIPILVLAALHDYYVSPSGHDEYLGTMQQPWKTPARVSRAELKPGDRVLFEGGKTFKGGLVLDASDAGTREKPVTIGSYGEGKAVLEVEETAILVKNAGGIVVRDLILRGARKGDGVRFENDRPGAVKLELVRIENVEASGFLRRGIGIDGVATDKSKSGFRDVRISGCSVRDNVYYGIQVMGPYDVNSAAYAHADVSIVDCRAYDNPGDPDFKKNHSGNGIQLGETDGGLIDRCSAWNNGAKCGSTGGGPVGIWAWSANRVTIQNCESYENRTGPAAVDGGGFDFDGGVSNSVMQHNYSHGNDGAGFMVYSFEGAPHRTENNIVRFNVSEGDGRNKSYAGIYVGQHGDRVRGVEVYHNTVVVRPSDRGKPRAAWVHDAEDVSFRNNVFVTEGGATLVQAEGSLKEVWFQGNAYWTSGGAFALRWLDKPYASLGAWRGATKQERLEGKDVGRLADPLFVGAGKGGTAYRLRAGSTLIDAGLPIQGPIKDMAGTDVPSGRAPDLGAFEFRD